MSSSSLSKNAANLDLVLSIVAVRCQATVFWGVSGLLEGNTQQLLLEFPRCTIYPNLKGSCHGISSHHQTRQPPHSVCHRLYWRVRLCLELGVPQVSRRVYSDICPLIANLINVIWSGEDSRAETFMLNSIAIWPHFVTPDDSSYTVKSAPCSCDIRPKRKADTPLAWTATW